jgi:UDP-glucuronate 4-epimerase
MRCLITGGAGFIGSHLSHRLLTQGNQVVILDALSEEYDPAVKLENLAQVRAAGAFEFIRADIRDTAAVSHALREHHVDAIFHLAAMPGVRRSVVAPLLCNDINVQGTLSLLEAAKSAGVRKLVFASSSSVYGTGVPIPFEETQTRACPISPYAASKLAGEHLCHAYAHLCGISIVCLRLFTVYGPRQRPDLAISKFIRAILDGAGIPLFGDGWSRRDYTYCADAVNAFVAAMDLESPFEVINVASGHPVFLRDVVSCIAGATNREPIICRMPPQAGDLDTTEANIDKARSLLDYAPSVPFSEGIRRQVEWTRNR